MKKLLFAVLLVVIMASYNQPKAIAANGKLFIIAIDNLEWSDFTSYELVNLQYMVEQGSAASLNPIAHGVRNRDNALFTLTSGRPSPANRESGFIMGINETIYSWPADKVFNFFTGKDSQGSIVHLGWQTVSLSEEYGLLGDLLKENSINGMYVSNANNERVQRSMGNLFITSKGYGNPIVLLGEPFIEKKRYFDLAGTDYQLISEEIAEYYNQLDLFVLELTELIALDEWANSLTKERYVSERSNILARYDYLLGRVLSLINPEEDLIILFNPAPSQSKISKRDFLTPIVFYGSSYQDGLLTSSTTKRSGLVVNYDIIPTIKAFFNLPTTGGVGREIVSVGVGLGIDKVIHLEKQYQSYLTVFRERPGIIKTYVFMQIALVSTALVAIIYKGTPRRLISLGLIFLIAFPLSLLLTSPFNFTLSAIAISNILCCSLLVAIVWYLEKAKKLLGFFAISAATSIAIFLDLLNNSYLIKQSILGYDPIAGARYYGIGNEYMGVFIGASLMTVGLAVQLFPSLGSYNYRRFLVLSIAIATVLFVGAPNLGTNVGGTIAAIIGFSYLIYWIFEDHFKIRYLMALPVAVPLVLMLIFIVDMNRSVETQSHIGRTAILVKENGVWELIDIIQRKVSMNIKLIKYTHWSRVFLVILGSMVILFYRPPGLLAAILSENQGLRAGIIAVIMGSFAALIFNDSGIVAAATMMVYGAMPLLFQVISE